MNELNLSNIFTLLGTTGGTLSAFDSSLPTELRAIFASVTGLIVAVKILGEHLNILAQTKAGAPKVSPLKNDIDYLASKLEDLSKKIAGGVQ